MTDAKVIDIGESAKPLGTRGRPGRGAGNARPSASARGLAGAAKTGRKTGSQAGSKAGSKAGSAAGESEKVAADKTAAPTPKGTREPAAGTATVSTLKVAPANAADADEQLTPSDWLAGFGVAAQAMFGDDWERKVAEFLAFLRRRLTGDYEIDEFGFDAEVVERFFVAALRPVAEKWFRIEVRGIENIPAEGGALVVSNHSGTLPVDGLMTMSVIHDHAGRNLRPLGADLIFRLPVVGEVARRVGVTLACQEDADRMLAQGELVGVWPEGFKGIGKAFSERYRLQRFGRGGFVSSAMRTGVPIIPVSVVGAEEIYPLVGNIPSLARLLGVPYIPITPFFPLLGPFGLIPLPSKWLIEFSEPVRTDAYHPSAAEDPMLVFNVTDQVRETIQQTLYRLLSEREGVFAP